MALLVQLVLVVAMATPALLALLALWEQLDLQASQVVLVQREKLVQPDPLDLRGLRVQEVSPVLTVVSALLALRVTLETTV